jgi:hypothetical protein
MGGRLGGVGRVDDNRDAGLVTTDIEDEPEPDINGHRTRGEALLSSLLIFSSLGEIF